MFIVIIVFSITLFFLAMLFMAWLGSPIAADMIGATQAVISNPSALLETSAVLIVCIITGIVAVWGIWSFLPDQERRMDYRGYAREKLHMSDAEVDSLLPYNLTPDEMEAVILNRQGGLLLTGYEPRRQ